MSSGKGGTRDYQRYAGLGLQLPATILLGFLAGHWADGRFGTTPWLTIAGSAVGMTVGFVSFITLVLKAERNEREGDRRG